MKKETNLEHDLEDGELFSPLHRETAAPPVAYRIARALLRMCFGLFLRNVRLLYSVAPAASRPAIFFVHHPASFLDALLLVATFEERVHCLLEEAQLSGTGRRLIAGSLEMISLQTEGEGWERTVTACCEILSRQGVVVVFAEGRTTASGRGPRQTERIARLTAEAEGRHPGHLRVSVRPVYLFVPVEQSQSQETLIFVGTPLQPETLPQGDTGAEGLGAGLAAALEKSSKENIFRLHEEDLAYFIQDLQDALRSDLEEDWTAKAKWKQRAEGFVISQEVVVWATILNDLHPGRLVALREAVETYRERRRQIALATLEIERLPRLNSTACRALIWAETIVGFPVALYGLLNHALVGLVLLSTGLLKRGRGGEKARAWIARMLIVLASYSTQILICDHVFGRAAAGYYAPSLVLSAIYLWRYAWVLRHRARLVFLRSRLPSQARANRRLRARLIEELSEATRSFAGMREAG